MASGVYVFVGSDWFFGHNWRKYRSKTSPYDRLFISVLGTNLPNKVLLQAFILRKNNGYVARFCAVGAMHSTTIPRIQKGFVQIDGVACELEAKTAFIDTSPTGL